MGRHFISKHMKIISANLNGIRSASSKGFFDWMESSDADVVCVQELKAQEADMTELFLSPFGYHGQFHYAEKKGYSGVGIYTRHTPSDVRVGFDGGEFAQLIVDNRAQFVRCIFGLIRIAIEEYSRRLRVGHFEAPNAAAASRTTFTLS